MSSLHRPMLAARAAVFMDTIKKFEQRADGKWYYRASTSTEVLDLHTMRERGICYDIIEIGRGQVYCLESRFEFLRSPTYKA